MEWTMINIWFKRIVWQFVVVELLFVCVVIFPTSAVCIFLALIPGTILFASCVVCMARFVEEAGKQHTPPSIVLVCIQEWRTWKK
jgi:hypothetical protein